MKKIALTLLFGAMTLTVFAQAKEWKIENISAINLGDGRLLFRQIDKDQTPLNGQHRVIDGYRSEYVLAEFKDGLYNGKYQYFKNDKLAQEATYMEGRIDGAYKKYYADGESLQSERYFVNGKVNGISKTYFQNGKIETEKVFKMDVEDGYDRRYNSEGKLTLDQYYKDGKKDGKWVEHLSGNRGNYTSISQYKEGKAEGQWSDTWEDGTPRNKSSYKNGLKDGVWVTYRKDGKLEKSTTYKADKKNGEEIICFTDGTPEKKANYQDDKLNGITKEFFHSSGKPKSEYTYKNGKRDGMYKRFYDDGVLREEGRCEADGEVYRKEYHSNGKLKSIAERKGGGWETLERYDSSGNKQ